MFYLPQGKNMSSTTPRADLVKCFWAIDSPQLIADACGASTPVGNAVSCMSMSDGLNSKVQKIKNMACGFRNIETSR